MYSGKLIFPRNNKIRVDKNFSTIAGGHRIIKAVSRTTKTDNALGQFVDPTPKKIIGMQIMIKIRESKSFSFPLRDFFVMNKKIPIPISQNRVCKE